MDTSNNHSRYSRSDLLALRNEECAQLRPSCANRADLQTLHFWKTNGNHLHSINSSSFPIKGGLSPERDVSSINSANGLLSSRRALRNRERAHNYYQRFTSSDQASSDEIVQGSSLTNAANGSAAYKSPSIDHRSISSAHLMPAFAKRRFVVSANAVASSGESGENKEQNESLNEDGSKDNNNGTASVQCNADSKIHTHANINPLGRSASDCDSGEKQSNLMDPAQTISSLSPTFLAGRQSSSTNVQERRFGSGRLLPRNDSWEYKNKGTDTSINNFDKDRPHSGGLSYQQQQQQQRLRTTSVKHNERSNDFLFERDRDRERRPNDRKLGDIRDQNDGNKNLQNGRRIANKDKFHYGESPGQNRGKRINMYQPHEKPEPEWFSAGPTSQHETIDLHGFDEFESENSFTRKSEVQIESKADQIGDIKLNPSSRSSSLSSPNTTVKNSNKWGTDLPKSSNHNYSVNEATKPEVEFNFDAYLNIDPMGNDCEVSGDNPGTSRFTQWFAAKEPLKGRDHTLIVGSSSPDTQEMPSVIDLEAQMKKVDLRTEYGSKNAHHLVHTDTKEKHITRDTEAFKRLLQQLGSQNCLTANVDSKTLISNRIGLRSNDTEHYNAGTLDNQPQTKKDEFPLYYPLSPKKNNVLVPHTNVEIMNQNPVHSAVPPTAHDHNLALQAHKRMEIQQLLHGVLRGELSVEGLENELRNPNTMPQSKEIIEAVLFEYSKAGRQQLSYSNQINSQNLLKNNHFLNKNNMDDDILSKNCSNQQQQGQQHPQQHQTRLTNSPTPLAFTPTSVLRKMTADKETISSSMNNNAAFNQHYQQQYKLSVPHPKHQLVAQGIILNEPPNQLQPRMILGGNYAIHQQQMNAGSSPQISPKSTPHLPQPRGQLNKWSSAGNMQTPGHASKSFGRPILKGTLNSNSQQISAAFLLNIELQQQLQQQKMKSMQAPNTKNNDNTHAVYKEGIVQLPHHHHHIQQQQRPHLPSHPQPQVQPAHRFNADLQRQTNLPMQSLTMTGIGSEGAESPIIIKNKSIGPVNYHRDDRLSPTRNQLAQWFSPELLARASAGKLPLLNMNQALSLEEFERNMQHSSATVLN